MGKSLSLLIVRSLLVDEPILISPKLIDVVLKNTSYYIEIPKHSIFNVLPPSQIMLKCVTEITLAIVGVYVTFNKNVHLFY